MKQSMIKALENRIVLMKEFDVTFTETLAGVIEDLDTLGIEFDVNALSDDKSVRSHIRKRVQKVNGIITRFKRDIAKVVEELNEVGNE